jgi:dUTP pyrophosphatase
MKVKFVKDHENAQLPTYGTAGAAGADIYSVHEYAIAPGGHALVDTGLKCNIPEGFELQVRPRSGLALKNKITVLNSPGTIDSDYTGKLGVILMNHSDTIFTVKPGDRIAQIVVAPVVQAKFEWAEETKDTERGSGGFGSTGV